MEAPRRGRPAMNTMGPRLRFQMDLQPHRPQKLPISVTVTWTVVALVRFIVAVLYFNDCPQQPNIPIYLLVLALATPLLTLLLSPSFMTAAPEHPNGLKAYVSNLVWAFAFFWLVAGDIWVFSVYQPNYDPAAADGLYCNKTLYTFTFWNAVWETSMTVINMVNVCKALLCCVAMTPNQDNNSQHFLECRLEDFWVYGHDLHHRQE